MTQQPAPLIGITTYGRNDQDQYHLYGYYVEAVRRAGGIPTLLPPGETACDRLFDRIDGLVLTGGGDIDPQRYSGPGHPMICRIDETRDEFEFTLAQLALQNTKPVLGICRGLQVLSVVAGVEKLVAHVPDVFGDRVPHRTAKKTGLEHRVALQPDSRLARVMGSTDIAVVSWHHQAVYAPPPQWVVVGQAEDGLIEAMEHSHHPWAIAVQWHPEMSPLDDPHQSALFRDFVQACRGLGI